MLAVVSLYLILGIGVDAIFVFVNTYAHEQAREEEAEAHRRQEADHHAPPWWHPSRAQAAREVRVLGRTLSHSIFVSGLSMVTTAVAFGASVASPISTIRQYAAFQTLVVLADYALLLLIFVPAMVAWRRCLFRRVATPPPRPGSETSSTPTDGERCRGPWWKPSVCIRWCSKLWRALCSSALCLLLPVRIVLAPASATFWLRVAPRVTRRLRVCMLLLWSSGLVLQLYYCTRLRPTAGAPSIFDPDHNMERRLALRRYAFAEGPASLNEAAQTATRLSGDLAIAVSAWINSDIGQACLATCDFSKLKDGRCDRECDTEACCSDGGDCGTCDEANLLGGASGDGFGIAPLEKPSSPPRPSPPPLPSLPEWLPPSSPCTLRAALPEPPVPPNTWGEQCVNVVRIR